MKHPKERILLIAKDVLLRWSSFQQALPSSEDSVIQVQHVASRVYQFECRQVFVHLHFGSDLFTESTQIVQNHLGKIKLSDRAACKSMEQKVSLWAEATGGVKGEACEVG